MGIHRPLRAEAAPSRSGQATELLRRGENRVNEAHRPQSVITSKAPPDLINPFIERIKSGMEALVVKQCLYPPAQLEEDIGEAIPT